MTLELERLEVGPWPMNCYLIRCRTTGNVAIVDPGADAGRILAALGEGQACCILLTHSHPDHVGALDKIHSATGVPIGVHPADAGALALDADFPLLHGMEVEVGQGRVRIFHVPGHTPGSVCLRLDGEALSGDAVFPGGPGYTESHQALLQSLKSLSATVFTWPDDTVLHPGHGAPTTVGAERPAFEAFMDADYPPDLHGDVTWR
ncbi:MAG: MBL fold metallo-hydrolase [Anaerolineae bacterium]|nr:MBL fold metallo-hydrolase [Anaerolineae bacterium]